MKRRRVTQTEFCRFVKQLAAPGTGLVVTHADGRIEAMSVVEYMRAKENGLEATHVHVAAHGRERIRA